MRSMNRAAFRPLAADRTGHSHLGCLIRSTCTLPTVSWRVHLTAEQVEEYYFGRLPPEHLRRVIAHLNRCIHCGTSLSELKEFISAMSVSRLQKWLQWIAPPARSLVGFHSTRRAGLGRALPPEPRVVLKVVFINSDGTAAPGGFTVDVTTKFAAASWPVMYNYLARSQDAFVAGCHQGL
jgi:hypothetical protein